MFFASDNMSLRASLLFLNKLQIKLFEQAANNLLHLFEWFTCIGLQSV